MWVLWSSDFILCFFFTRLLISVVCVPFCLLAPENMDASMFEKPSLRTVAILGLSQVWGSLCCLGLNIVSISLTLDLAQTFGYSFGSYCSPIPAFPFHVLLIWSAKTSIKSIKFLRINENGFGFLLEMYWLNKLLWFIFLIFTSQAHFSAWLMCIQSDFISVKRLDVWRLGSSQMRLAARHLSFILSAR